MPAKKSPRKPPAKTPADKADKPKSASNKAAKPKHTRRTAKTKPAKWRNLLIAILLYRL